MQKLNNFIVLKVYILTRIGSGHPNFLPHTSNRRAFASYLTGSGPRCRTEGFIRFFVALLALLCSTSSLFPRLPIGCWSQKWPGGNFHILRPWAWRQKVLQRQVEERDQPESLWVCLSRWLILLFSVRQLSSQDTVCSGFFTQL